ncbi:helix-hairpin-helix domain-containing protein [Halobacillus seohaensis]|uniref:Helix-hairpin-helix domain-containing protein n=1 Tax=Halobacillus seohaensis TaxID=447421 RepID=A0ABW2EN69_9BACI
MEDIKAAGIEEIHTMVATHPDADHIGGLVDVLEEIKVNHVVDSGKEHTTQTYMDYLSLIDQKNKPFDVAEQGSNLNVGDHVKLKVINAMNSSSDLNESSIALKLSHEYIDFMLTGDASTENESSMLQNYDVEAEILKVGHHGSSTSTSQAFMDQVDSELGILSYGENGYGHPDPNVVKRLQDAGASLYSTFESGDILVSTDGSSYDVSANTWEGNDSSSDPELDEPEGQYPINVNTADYETLQLITGVGTTIANNIIDYRNANGPFQTIEELDNVSYIGPATIEEMRPDITL